MLPFLHRLPRSTYFMLLGILLATGAPTGWWLCSQWIEPEARDAAIYIYMIVGTSLTFGSFGFWVGYSQDLLYRLIETDSLTVLLNQKAFFRHLEAYYPIGLRYQDRLGIIMIDIDHFKQVNDQHNHLIGSDIIKQFALILSLMTRESDLVARYGGDEFVIGVPRAEDGEALLKLAERIRTTIAAKTFLSRGERIRITISMGLVIAPCSAESTIDQLIQQADQQLYLAKKNGRNRVEILDLTLASQSPRACS